jgi:hypothetical protein
MSIIPKNLQDLVPQPKQDTVTNIVITKNNEVVCDFEFFQKGSCSNMSIEESIINSSGPNYKNPTLNRQCIQIELSSEEPHSRAQASAPPPPSEPLEQPQEPKVQLAASAPPPPPPDEPLEQPQGEQAQEPEAQPAAGDGNQIEEEANAEEAMQAAAEPEEVPENVLEEMALLSHGTVAHTEQEQSQQSPHSNKNGVQSEMQKGMKTYEKTNPAPREQSAHLAASAAMKKLNGELRNSPQGKTPDPSMLADHRMASTIQDKNALMQHSGLKNWDIVRAEFKQLLQIALKNSEPPLPHGKSAGSTLPFTTAQGTLTGNLKSTAFLNSSKQFTFSSPDFTGAANKQKAEAFALGLKLLQACMGKQLDETFAATGRTIREEVIAGRIPLSASIPKDLKEILTGLLLGTPTLLTIKEALAMLALSKETLTAQGLPQALYYSPSQPLAGKPTQHSHAITAIAAVPGSTLFLSQSPMDQDNSAQEEEEEEEEEGEHPLIRAVVFGSAEIASEAELLMKELKETQIKVVVLAIEPSSKESYDLTAILKRAEWEKPSWKTQLFLAERLDVPAQETLFIAKDAKQAASARALGFEVIEYKSLIQLKHECIKILGQKEH